MWLVSKQSRPKHWLEHIRHGLNESDGNEVIVPGWHGSRHVHLTTEDIDDFLASQKRKIRWQGRLYQSLIICLCGALGILSLGVYQKQIENILASEHYAKLEAERDALEQAFSLYTEFTRDIVGDHHDELSTMLGELGTNTRAVINAGANAPGTGGFGSAAEDSSILREYVDPATARNLHEISRIREFVSRLPLTRPLESAQLTSGFGMREHPVTGHVVPHRGIDLVSWEDPTVISAGAGVVTFAAADGNAGNMVTIEHGSGIESRYFHLDSIAVDVGDFVNAGDAIGVMGDTGLTNGAHLHFELIVAGKHLDPQRVTEVVNNAE